MKKAARRGMATTATVLKAAQFKAKALAVMRRVQESGQSVIITNRGKAMVRIEPIRDQKARVGYGSMKGTVEFLVPEDQLVSPGGSEWGTIEDWDAAIES
jgi:prevent-host-death family protein